MNSNSITLLLLDRGPDRKPLTSNTPISFHSIWVPELGSCAFGATTYWQNDLSDTGEIYLINVNNVPVGITGWFPQEPGNIGLRWHGVHPSHQRMGISRYAFSILLTKIPEDAKCIFEVTRNPIGKAFYQSCGFQVTDDALDILEAVTHSNYSQENGWVLKKIIK
jgi:GNAT superfamily N-acetyltransferase